MQKINIDHPDALKLAASVLDKGGVVMHPTETCYGLAVDVFNKQALKKLYKVKKMSLDKPVSILVDGLSMALRYGVFSHKALQLAKDYWPGALSIVVPRKRDLPEFLNPGNDFISFRYSVLSFCTEMVKVEGDFVTILRQGDVILSE